MLNIKIDDLKKNGDHQMITLYRMNVLEISRQIVPLDKMEIEKKDYFHLHNFDDLKEKNMDVWNIDESLYEPR